MLSEEQGSACRCRLEGARAQPAHPAVRKSFVLRGEGFTPSLRIGPNATQLCPSNADDDHSDEHSSAARNTLSFPPRAHAPQRRNAARRDLRSDGRAAAAPRSRRRRSEARAQLGKTGAGSVGALARVDRPVSPRLASRLVLASLSSVRADIDRRAMALLSSGHFATDFSNGALPALLPFLKDKFSLSYTAVGAVILASQASSSLIQPLFGLWSDRRGAMWLLPAGVAVAGAGIAVAADAPSYSLVLLLVLVSGLGSAAFHPEGSKFAGFVSGRKRASGMSWFSIGGNLGFAFGPLATTAVVAAFGLHGGLLLAIPALAVALAFLAGSPYLRRFAPDPGARRAVTGDD